MRMVTRRAAGLDDGGWTGEVRGEVEQVFDVLAAEWHTRVTPERIAVVADALERGLRRGAGAGGGTGLAVEIGSGIGTYSAMLDDRFGAVLAVDLSLEMLRRAPERPGHRVQADAQLPAAAPTASAAAVVLVNAFLFPAEVDRVLAPRRRRRVGEQQRRGHADPPAGRRGRAGPARDAGTASPAGPGSVCGASSGGAAGLTARE